MCTIRGQEDETDHHALIRCTYARNLWTGMRSVWHLPPDDVLRNAEPDWLLMLLQQISETQRLLVLMMLWRVWHVHNELAHDKPMIPVEASKRFLCEYAESLFMIKYYPNADVTKGKFPADLSAYATMSAATPERHVFFLKQAQNGMLLLLTGIPRQ